MLNNKIMKKVFSYGAILLLIVGLSCQKEEIIEDGKSHSVDTKKSWLDVNLNSSFAIKQREVTSYVFSAKELAKVINDQEVKEVLFVLGFEKGRIKIEAVGVDQLDKEIVGITSHVFVKTNYENQLMKLNNNDSYKISSRPIVSKHILDSKLAFQGIQSWKDKLSKNIDLNEITSYGGDRIRYYSLEKEVIQAMIDNPKTINIGLFLGLNSDGKLTTIFIGLDKDNNISVSPFSSAKGTSIEGIDGPVFDFSTPCPPCAPVQIIPINKVY